MLKTFMIKRSVFLATVLLWAPAGKGSDKNKTEPFPVVPVVSEKGFQRSTNERLSREQFQIELARLDRLAEAGNLDDLVKAGNLLEERWGRAAGEFYGQLMLNLANLIVNNFNDERIYSLGQKFIIQALEKSGTFSLELETRLLPFLAMDVSSDSSSGEAQQSWLKERSLKARLWLHGWTRLESQINRRFNFDDRPSLNVTPPVETGMPAGVSLEAIKDNRLRAKYKQLIDANTAKAQEHSRQFKLRYLDSIFPKRAEEYLVTAYSKPPDRLMELRKYLITNRLRSDVRERLLSRITRNQSTTK